MGLVPIAETLNLHFHFGGDFQCPEFGNGERIATPVEVEIGHVQNLETVNFQYICILT